MNVIKNLVEKLCPDGIKIQKLGQLESDGVVKLGRGEVISKTDLALYEGDFPVYSSSASDIGVFGYYGKYMFNDTRITWSIDGGGKFFFRSPHKYSVTNVCGWLKVLNEETLNPKYLYYVLISGWGTRTYNYTVKAHPSVIKEDYFIPLPPFEIQNEIVKILDTFAELEFELEAELEARKKQIGYYARYMNEVFNSDEVTSLPLSKIAEIGTGSSNTQDATQGGKYPFYVRSQTPMLINSYEFDETAVITAGDGVGVGKVFHFVEGKYALHQRAYRLKVFNKDILPKYLFYYVKYNFGKYLETSAFHSSVTSLRRPMFEEFQILFPSQESQGIIVGFLDKLENYVGDSSIGLVAEIEARKKQYEYYRDKLLTFKQLESA